MAITFAARAALRVTPLLSTALYPRGGGVARVARDIVLPVLRAMIAPGVADQHPTPGAEEFRFALAAADAASAAAAVSSYTHAAFAYVAFAAAAAHAAAAAFRVGSSSVAAHAASASATSVTADAASATAAAAAAADAQLIDQGVSAAALAGQPLWLNGEPDWVREAWGQLERALLADNPDWKVWTDWYRARLEGRPSIKALEVVRVMIAEDIWKRGPRAVNAEIARLMEEFRERETVQDAVAPSDPREIPTQVHVLASLGLETGPPVLGRPVLLSRLPEIPAQRPAAVEPIWQKGRLTVSKKPAKTGLSKKKFADALSGLRQELREFAGDLADEANIDRRFVSFLRRLADGIPDALPPQDALFRLGHVEELFAGYAKTVDEEWPDFLAARYHSLTLQFDRTMRQSAVWREFKRSAAEQSLSEAQISAARPLAAETASALRQEEAREFADPALPDSLEELAAALQRTLTPSGDGSPLTAAEAGSELLAIDLVESVNNALKRIAEGALAAAAASGRGLGRAGKTLAGAGGAYGKGFGDGFIKAAKRQSPKDGEKAFKWLRRIVITSAVGGGAAQAGVFTQLAQLIAKYPEAFEWLQRVLHYIK